MTTQTQIDSFHYFASEQIKDGSKLPVTALFDLWQVQNLSEEELSESTAAVQAALNDMENGDSGRLFNQFANEMRSQHDIPTVE